MKNACWLLVPFAIGCLTSGCDKKTTGSTCPNVAINAVQPNTNPPGYEVLIKATGFSMAAKVHFGTVEATSRAGGESDDIIARVPAGLSGNVEVSVEEGDCLARSGGFIVSGGLPSGVQPSLMDILVPALTPPPFPDAINNDWPNAADINRGIHLTGNLVGGVASITEGFELPSNINIPVTGTVNINTNVVYLEVNRSSIGGIVEHFDGKFIPLSSVLPSNATSAILLVSRETGRQLIIYRPF